MTRLERQSDQSLDKATQSQRSVTFNLGTRGNLPLKDAKLMTKSDDLQMQSGPSSKPAGKRIEEREDEFTHDSWNIVPSELNFNAHNADGVFSKDNRQDYVVFLREAEGKIAFIREYFDPVRAADALGTPLLGLQSLEQSMLPSLRLC